MPKSKEPKDRQILVKRVEKKSISAEEKNQPKHVTLVKNI